MNSAAALVSVVVPAYNAAVTLHETLKSALAQTYRNLEVIVVDDGSSDGTASIVQAEVGQDSRLRLLRQTNAGVAAARNLGILEARGDLIAILDADDLWHPTKIAKQVEVFRRKRANLGLVYTWFRRIDDVGGIISSSCPTLFEGDVYAALIMENFVGGGSTALMRRDHLMEVGGFDMRFQGLADAELFLRVAERYDFAVVPEYLMGYRVSTGSMSQDLSHMLQQTQLMLAEARERHPELPGRLWRWAQGSCSSWIAEASFDRGRFAAGVYLLLRTLQYDPGVVLQPKTAGLLAHSLRKRLGLPRLRPAFLRVLERLRLRRVCQAAGAPGCAGRSFLATPPEPEPFAAPRTERSRRRCLRGRRQVAAASFRIHRRPGAFRRVYAAELQRMGN